MIHELAHSLILFAGGVALAVIYRTVRSNWTRIKEVLRG